MVAKKQGIVLLITLMFILSISGLILKNLDDSNKYIDASNKDMYYVNGILSINNLKTELISYLVKNEKSLSQVLDNEKLKEGFVLNYGNVQSNIKLEAYENVYNLNMLTQDDAEKYEDIQELFLQNSVSSFDEFKNFVKVKIKKYGELSSFKQITSLLEEFAVSNENNEIMQLKDHLTFINIDENNDYVKCFVETKFNEQISMSEFIIDIKAKNAQGLNIVFQ